MGSAPEPNIKYNSQKLASADGWLQGSGNQVYTGQDQVLNILNDSSNKINTKRILDTEKEKSDAELMADLSPFGQKASKIEHEVVTSDNFRRRDGDTILNDELGDNDLEFEDGGKLYNMSFHEFFKHPNSSEEDNRIDRNNLDEIDQDLELLTVHTIVYEKPSGEEYMLHWDPGTNTEKGKNKFIEMNGEPSPHLAKDKWSRDDFFKDYSNHSLEEGLKNVARSLEKMKEKLYREANRKMLENSARDTDLAKALEQKYKEAGNPTSGELRNYKSKLDKQTEELGYSDEVRKMVWRAERWRAMSDVVEAFGQSYRSGAAQDKQRYKQK